jgi:hypothetical protein
MQHSGMVGKPRPLYIPGMVMSLMQSDPFRRGAPPPETPEARQRRLAREAEMIAEAEAELAAGQGISQAEANAWLDSLDTDHPLPFPSRA